MRRVTSISPVDHFGRPRAGEVVLAHDERHLRRKLLHLTDGSMVMLDLKSSVMLADGDLLEVDDETLVTVIAAPERLIEIRVSGPRELAELAWHIGNRHLPAQIEESRILILYDHVILDMLKGLGAEVREIEERFQPMRGAYHGHGHNHHPHG
ncbi:urease accessory protein UreE [Rhizobium halophytocola]|uniref:Urease accessory protein UreE n=1 Tax=Rhizobium halophytocola TaxID=735519 RepID=A0ABS4DSL3_9HYPH|nr:urease accessory protein UreE [Rhizobium halophytocola]MBP1848684.1 urease accessory protein [Rhizobium halophytocola]